MKTYWYLLMVMFMMLASCSHQPSKPVKPEKTNPTVPKTEPKTDSSPTQPPPPDAPKEHLQKNIVVWADDGSELALAIQNPASDPATLNSPQHQIWVQNPAGSERRAITEWRNDRPRQMFYMKPAGYFVVESLLANGARRFDKITANGNEILIIETPDSEHQACQLPPSGSEQSLPLQVEQTVIPSPDGQQLAHIYSPECGKVTVEFLHANSLNIFDNQTMTIDEAMRATWHREGYIILANYNNDKAWKVTPLAPPLPVLPPNCLSPVTTSSEISLAGQRVHLEGDTLVTEEIGRDKAFGCQ